MKTQLHKEQMFNKLEKIRPSPKIPSINTQYYIDFLRVTGNGPPRDLYLYPLAHIPKEVYLNVITALKKFSLYVYKEPKFLELLDIPKLDISSCIKRNPETMFNYARIDSVYSPNGYRILEVNTVRPQLYEDSDWISDYLSGLLPEIIKENNSLEIVNAIKTNVELNGLKDPANILLISDFIHFIAQKKHRSYFYKAIQKVFPNNNIMQVRTDELDRFYEGVYIKQDRLFDMNNNPIDLIILQETGKNEKIFIKPDGSFQSPIITEAYNKSLIEIASPLSTQIMGSKLSLPFIQNSEIQNLIHLTDEEKESVRCILPVITINHPDEVNIPKLSAEEKNNYVIKIPYVGRGRGVTFGSEMGVDELKSYIINELINYGRVTIQENLPLQSDKIYDLHKFKEVDASVTLDPFVINNPARNHNPYISGYSSRAILSKNLKPGMKFNPETDRPEIMFGGIVETSEISHE